MQTPIFGSDAAKRFHNELLDSIGSLAEIAELHGPKTLAFIVYLQEAILDGSFIEVFPDDNPAILGVLEELPSHDQWIRFVNTHIEGQEEGPFIPVREQQRASTATLRTDVPNEVLEMLLFEGEPQHRSREELEAQWVYASSFPYLVKWLGERPERAELLEQAKALGFDSIAQMHEHNEWLLLNGSEEFRNWYRGVKRAKTKVE